MKIEIKEKGSKEFFQEVTNAAVQYRHFLKNPQRKLQDYFKTYKLYTILCAVLAALILIMNFAWGWDTLGIVAVVILVIAAVFSAAFCSNLNKVLANMMNDARSSVLTLDEQGVELDKEDIPLVLLDYLGVTARMRSGGLGAKMLAALKAQGRPLILESELPVDGETQEENAIRRRRIAFYERNGFVPAYEMATCGMRWQAMLAGGEGYPLEAVMRWHKALYDEKRTDVKVPLGPDEVPQLPYWMQ